MKTGLKIIVTDLQLLNPVQCPMCTISVSGISHRVSYPFAAVSFDETELTDHGTLSFTVSDSYREIGSFEVNLKVLFYPEIRDIDKVFTLTESDKTVVGRVRISFSPSLSKECLKCGELQKLVDSLQQSHGPLTVNEISEGSGHEYKQLIEKQSVKDELRGRLEENQRNFKETYTKQSEVIDSLIKELHDAKQLHRDAVENNRDLVMRENTNQHQINQLEFEVKNLTSHRILQSELTDNGGENREMLEEAWKARDTLSKQYYDSVNEFSHNSAQQGERISTLISENSDLRKVAEDLETTLHSLKHEFDQLNSSNLSLKSQLAKSTSLCNLADSFKQQISKVESLLSQSTHSNNTLKAELADLQQFHSESHEKSSRLNNLLATENTRLSTSVSSLQQDFSHKAQELHQYKKEIHDLKATIFLLEEKTFIQQDFQQTIHSLHKQSTIESQEKATLQKDLQQLSVTVSKQSKAIHHANSAIDSLEDITKQQEADNSHLKSVIYTLKHQKATYIPIRDDPVDIALADYINTDTVAQSVPFIREDAGTYTFGTKRIFVKLEQGKLIFRVGGGFMQIEDFLEIYSPVELEKFEQKQREKAQSIRHGLYGKYAGKLLTENKSRDASPKHTSMKTLVPGKYSTFFAVQRKN